VILESYLEGVTIPPTPADVRPLRTTSSHAALRRDEVSVIELLRQRSKSEPLKPAVDDPTAAATSPDDRQDDAA
jgi:hypothetical protein